MPELDYKQQQLEALSELYSYNKKLTKAIIDMIKELREELKDDSNEYLNLLTDGINWEFNVLNHTLDLINESEVVISAEYLSSVANNLSSAIQSKDALRIAEIFEKDIVKVFTTLDNTLANIVTIKEN